MTAKAYPELTAVTGMDKHLTPKQRAIHIIEGIKPLHLTCILWLSGILSSIIAGNVAVDHRSPFFLATAIFFFSSIVSFHIFWTKRKLIGANDYADIRISLMQMGVKRPMRFIKEHPLHLAAYEELVEALKSSDNVRFLDMMFNRHHAIAMLVFTGANRHSSGPAILSLVNDRGLIQPLQIIPMLDEMANHHSELSEGAL